MSQTCPICRKPAVPDARPFCSARCAEVDLGRWLSEHYVLPGRDGEAGDHERFGDGSDPLDTPERLG